MPDRRNRSIRRPSIVVMALGAATLAALPQTGVLVSGPIPATSVPISAAGPRLAELLTAAVPATAAERAARAPGTEGIRINPVAFRAWNAVTPGTPAAAPSRPFSSGPSGPLSSGADQPRITTTARPGTAAAAAIDFALAQRGLPYIWGGNGPQRGDAGFDCSGLTTAAYDYAGVDLPRTAHTQYYAGPHLPSDAELQPGDLVFYGVPQRVHHVGLYIGEGRMVAAPTFGKPVRISYVRYTGDDYLGATRPAAGRDAGELDEGLLATPDLPVVVPPTPDLTVPPAPEEFAAPEVPATELLPTEPPAAGTAEPRPDARPADEAEQDATAAPDDQDLGDPDGEESGDQDGIGDAETLAVGPSIESTPDPTVRGAGVTPSPAPETAAAETSEADAPTTDAPTTETSAPAETSTPETSTPETTTAPETTPAAASRPTSLTLPGGGELTLTGVERGEDDLPVAPAGPGTGGLRFSPAEEGRAARATVSLHPDADTPGPGATLVLRGEDGTTTELTVRSRQTVDAATAADLASGRGDSTRVVLLLADPDTGEVLVVIAE